MTQMITIMTALKKAGVHSYDVEKIHGEGDAQKRIKFLYQISTSDFGAVGFFFGLFLSFSKLLIMKGISFITKRNDSIPIINSQYSQLTSELDVLNCSLYFILLCKFQLQIIVKT